MSIEYLETEYQKIEYLCNLLIERATGGFGDDNEYKILRSELLQNKALSQYLPNWLKTNRNLDSFWGFIKPKFGTYAERRTFVTNEFLKILDFLEFGTGIQPSQINGTEQKQTLKGTIMSKNKVFIVHGHDNETKQEVARFIDRLGLETIILHEKASSGMTIIEKIEHYSDESDFTIVLYTPCDKGRKSTETKTSANYRARQNVVFEHGYLMAKLGRQNVCALVKGEIETSNDISGVVYVSLDLAGAWKIDLSKELKACGYTINSII